MILLTTAYQDWSGTPVRLVTMHGKEAQIAPALGAIGLTVQVAHEDTDQFGAFSGTIPRTDPPDEVAVRKALLGIERTGYRLGLASEGSFGGYPGLPLLTADSELVTLVDTASGLVVSGHAIRPASVAVQSDVAPGDDLHRILQRADLPRHRLVARPVGVTATSTNVRGGLADPEAVQTAVRDLAALSPAGRVELSTDFRAHLCPSRQRVIALAAADLARRLGAHCPACHLPGWGFERRVPGAPCRDCGTPTGTARAEVFACPGCGHSEETPTAQATTGDPAACHRCNP